MAKTNNDEEYLRQHLNDIDSSNKSTTQDTIYKMATEGAKTSDLQFFNFDVRELPCGNFYPKGTMFAVRPAQVKEIQAYSMVDDNNIMDIVEKMNGMLASCVRVKYPDGTVATYLDIKDQDRIYLIFVIRELTFQQGNSLATKAKCVCGCENQVELKRQNFRFHPIDASLSKFFDESRRSFSFKIKNGKTFELTPPTIGIQKAFTEFIIKESQEKRTPNLSFLKIVPFMLDGRNSITMEGIEQKLKDFENNMDDISFQFLNGAIGKLSFGIKEIVQPCIVCGSEVHTEMTFPNGSSGIFVIHDAFEAFIQE